MTLTDDDLRQLKNDATYFEQKRLLAFIARLEAAEAVCNLAEINGGEGVKNSLAAWREAAGK